MAPPDGAPWRGWLAAPPLLPAALDPLRGVPVAAALRRMKPVASDAADPVVLPLWRRPRGAGHAGCNAMHNLRCTTRADQ